MTETITVKGVEKNDKGWFEVELEDGRTAATKDQAIADAAFASRGKEITAEIGTTKRGKFTNHYLNKIGDVGETRSNGTRKRSPSSGAGRDPDVQEAIRRQWAYGRATELMVGLGEYHLPLNEDDQRVLRETADFLLAQTKV